MVCSYLTSQKLKVLELGKESCCWSAEVSQGHVHGRRDCRQIPWQACAHITLRINAAPSASTACKRTRRMSE